MSDEIKPLTPKAVRDLESIKGRLTDKLLGYIEIVESTIPEPEKTYYVGQRFKKANGSKYVLSRATDKLRGSHNVEVALVKYDGVRNLGNRYSEPYIVVWVNKITVGEFSAICGGTLEHFTLIDEED